MIYSSCIDCVHLVVYYAATSWFWLLLHISTHAVSKQWSFTCAFYKWLCPFKSPSRVIFTLNLFSLSVLSCSWFPFFVLSCTVSGSSVSLGHIYNRSCRSKNSFVRSLIYLCIYMCWALEKALALAWFALWCVWGEASDQWFSDKRGVHVPPPNSYITVWPYLTNQTPAFWGGIRGHAHWSPDCFISIIQWMVFVFAIHFYYTVA